jgi:hypothetical protein
VSDFLNKRPQFARKKKTSRILRLVFRTSARRGREAPR